MKKKPPKGPRKVREPIQVFLTADERALLDDAGPMLSFLDSVAGKDLPADLGARHEEHLAEAYLDRHDAT